MLQASLVASAPVSLRTTTLSRGSSSLALTQLAERDRQRATPPHACDAAVDKSMELFFWVYDIAAVTWNERKVKELESNEGCKAAYVKKQYDIVDKVQEVMDAVTTGGMEKCVAHLSALSIAKVCAEKRSTKQRAYCIRMKLKNPMNEKMAQLDVMNQSFMVLALLSPKLSVWMMNPDVATNADEGPSFESLLQTAEEDDAFADTCPYDPAKSAVSKAGDGGGFLEIGSGEAQMTPAFLQKGVGPGMFDGLFKGLKAAPFAAITLIVGGVALFIFGGVIAKVVACVIAVIGAAIGIAALVVVIAIGNAMRKHL
uniref:Uncharacterized protein n=1 Tax=Chromera velia CCMP2878 TaxID=1169474 RepID=A0A0G4G8M6_9ALVE|eukprot:Cvel_20653.t1-p1 / transcript=Cvel_20653.t1 / gene=Cvel_20653 / organism=Chromera_velia_CCMP2878 / gene_product=hypothetical protein / transcript_product=hypothetical protein / location=Cvel_scaffold1874:9333-10700(+) / protein_length=312 / sequence_SO=supercontig / SO=protein_coding / is_pseudo=false